MMRKAAPPPKLVASQLHVIRAHEPRQIARRDEDRHDREDDAEPAHVCNQEQIVGLKCSPLRHSDNVTTALGLGMSAMGRVPSFAPCRIPDIGAARRKQTPPRSVRGGEADIAADTAQCRLTTKSGHSTRLGKRTCCLPKTLPPRSRSWGGAQFGARPIQPASEPSSSESCRQSAPFAS